MASPFTSQFTDTIPIPGDDGQSAVIRKLAPAKLQLAQKASQRKAMEDIQALGGMSVYKELWGDQNEETKKKAEVPDPLLLYDRALLLEHGLVSWTYGELTAERIADLDDDVQETLARAILKLAKPSLFTTYEEQQAARKNDSALSIVH